MRCRQSNRLRSGLRIQTYLPPFTTEDWDPPKQIESILTKFEEFTLTVSKRQPQISLVIPIYYELHDTLNDAVSRQGEFLHLDPDIASAVSAGISKYKKYYDFMDGQDAYYIALVLDPRFKTLLLEKELGKDTAPKVIKHIKELLHEQYPLKEDQSPVSNEEQVIVGQIIEAQVLQMLQPQKQQLSDIDRYFEDGVVMVQEPVTKEKV
jgi:hypothetical protein